MGFLPQIEFFSQKVIIGVEAKIPVDFFGGDTLKLRLWLDVWDWQSCKILPKFQFMVGMERSSAKAGSPPGPSLGANLMMRSHVFLAAPLLFANSEPAYL